MHSPLQGYSHCGMAGPPHMVADGFDGVLTANTDYSVEVNVLAACLDR